MKNEKAGKLVKKYLDDTCSEEERAVAESWYIQAAELEPDEPGDPDYMSIEQEILQALREKQVPITRSGNIWPRLVAATLFMILSAGLYFYVSNGLRNNETKRPVVNRIHDIVPGANKAILTLADGTVISLSDAANGQLAEQTGVNIKKSENGELVYTVKDEPATKNKNEFNTIATPLGGQYQVNLPDGTKVWLNASSSLRYPVTFFGKERKVELNGEAYFEVSPDKKHPFIVLSNKQTVEVLGTHFNISGYKDENNWKTTLLEGSVKVFSAENACLLKPGQEAKVGKNELISVSEVDVEEAVAWKNGYFIFNSEDIEGIMRKVSRWYNVNVEYKGRVTKEKFNGTISRDKNINQVLEMLETTNDVHFKIEGRRITVMN